MARRGAAAHRINMVTEYATYGICQRCSTDETYEHAGRGLDAQRNKKKIAELKYGNCHSFLAFNNIKFNGTTYFRKRQAI